MTHSNKIKNTIILVVSFMTFFSCHSQEKENKMDKKESTIINDYFAKYKFKNTEDNFNKVNENLLGILPNKLQNGYNDILIFNESTDYQISKEERFIKIGNDILPDLDSIDINNNEKHPYFDELLILNKIIYQDDLTSILNIATKNSDLALDLVVLFNYEKNEALLQTVVRNIENLDDIPKSHKLAFVFYNNANKSINIREKLLKKLQTKETFLYELTFYLADNQENIIKKNGIPLPVLEKSIAYLLNLGFDAKEDVDVQVDKSYLLLNNIYVSHPELLKTFEKNKYFGFKNLEKYSKTYELLQVDTQGSIDAIIQDPDGYTNLRKDKNTSSEVLQKIKSGEHIEVLNSTEDWFLIKTSDGKQGYVHKSRVKSN